MCYSYYVYRGKYFAMVFILQLTLSPKIIFGAALLKVIINFSDPLNVVIFHNLHVTWN